MAKVGNESVGPHFETSIITIESDLDTLSLEDFDRLVNNSIEDLLLDPEQIQIIRRTRGRIHFLKIPFGGEAIPPLVTTPAIGLMERQLLTNRGIFAVSHNDFSSHPDIIRELILLNHEGLEDSYLPVMAQVLRERFFQHNPPKPLEPSDSSDSFEPIPIKLDRHYDPRVRLEDLIILRKEWDEVNYNVYGTHVPLDSTQIKTFNRVLSCGLPLPTSKGPLRSLWSKMFKN